jgi:pimeloyl-ACP methyl ester carboxylesterase
MNPHLVLVHGAWHNADAFSALRGLLAQRTIDSSVVELGSVAAEGETIGDMYQDAERVRDAIDALDQPCYVLAHSYGGIPVSQGLAGATNVQGLIFLTAFVLGRGETLFEACGSQDPPWWLRSDDNTRVVPKDPSSIFYNTCDKETARLAEQSLRTQSLSSFTQPLTHCAWERIPSTYITCSLDKAIPLFAQEAMAQRTTTVHALKTDHSPFLSDPQTLAEIIATTMGAKNAD